MTVIGSKQYQQTAITSAAAKKKKIAQQQHVKSERAQANQRGLALLSEKASKEHQEEITQEAERLSLFNLFSQINRSNPKEQEGEVRTLLNAENDIQGDKKSIKDEDKDKENESSEAFDKPITSASYQSLAVLGASFASHASSQSAASGAMTEAKFQQLQNLLIQMAAQVSVNAKRSEFTITLDPALFLDTQLKIQLDEQGMQVDYSCGHATETAWFGNNAAELSKRLTKALNCSVKIQSSERWPATS